jgi:Na+(H+)/acetate symporter ActP
MQFFILFIGAMVFVFYLFVEPPVLFQHAELARITKTSEFPPLAEQYQRAFDHRRQAAFALVEAHRSGDTAVEQQRRAEYRAAQQEIDTARTATAKLVEKTGGEKGFTDTNYIFLSFVTRYLPSGIVGLVIAVILAATMSASSGEINSLATVSVIDIYQRYVKPVGTDHHYLMASRWATLFWGMYAVLFAGYARRLGSLIVAVNKVGSLFYGSLLGCFVLAFAFPRVRGTAAFAGMLVGEAVVLALANFTDVSWLWFNGIGCVAVMITALAISAFQDGASSAIPGRMHPR